MGFVRGLGNRIVAESIFVLHTALMVLLLFGWLLSAPYYYVYVAGLALTLGTQFVFRNCLFTTWEFYFRKKLDPTIKESPYYLTYYTHKMFPNAVSDAFVDRISLIFLSVSILAAALRIGGYL